MTTVALVAAKDAAASIGDTVAAIRALRGIDEVWVVDDGSDDATAATAEAAGARVLRLARNRGKGGALDAGLTATPHATRYLLADADLGTTAIGLQPLLDASGPFVVGVLPGPDGRGGFGLVRSLAAAGIRYASGAQVHAPLSGQRLVDADLLRATQLAPRFGVEVGTTIDLVRLGAVPVEVQVSVDHHHRGRGVAGFAHRARQGVDVAGVLVNRLTTARQRIVATVVAAVIVFGALSGVSAVRRAPAGAAMPVTRQVVVFAYDGLGLADLEASDRPNLRRLRANAAIGALSVRTADRRSLSNRGGSERPSLADAYASASASARVRWGADMGSSRRLAQRDHADSLPGSLGDALGAAGRRTAVVASDPRSNSSALVADRRGRVDAVIPSTAALRSRLDAALRAAQVIVVEPRRGRADEDLGALYDGLPKSALLIVFAPAPPTRDWELTPVLIAGAGIDGPVAIASATTRRRGLGGIVDVAPTVLTALRLDIPPAMTGAALRVTGDAPDLAALRRLQVDGAVRSRFFLPAGVGYTVVAVAFYLAFLVALRKPVRGKLRRTTRLGVCALAAFPLASLVTGALQHWWHTGGESVWVLTTVSLLLGAFADRWRGVGPASVLAVATLTLIALDVAATGPLHASSILGYSIQTTGRYYGLPNASFAVYAASLFLLAGAVAGWAPDRVRATGAAAVLAVGVAFVAAPWLGNDVGGTLTLLPIGLAAAFCWFGGRFTPRVVALGTGLVAAGFGALALVETLGGTTHLGRAVSGDGALLNTLTRRFEANLGLLVDQWWGFVSLAGAAAVVVWLRRPERYLDYLPQRSGQRVAALAISAASVVGFVVNDSGPVVNVLCLVVLAPALALNALARSRGVISPAPRP